MNNLKNWIYYSGASVSVTLNPLHWRLKPWASKESVSDWPTNEMTLTVSWLFLTVRVWLDDGSW